MFSANLKSRTLGLGFCFSLGFRQRVWAQGFGAQLAFRHSLTAVGPATYQCMFNHSGMRRNASKKLVNQCVILRGVQTVTRETLAIHMATLTSKPLVMPMTTTTTMMTATTMVMVVLLLVMMTRCRG